MKVPASPGRRPRGGEAHSVSAAGDISETDMLASKADGNPDSLARMVIGEAAMAGGWQGLAGALLLFGALSLAPEAAAQEAGQMRDMPDFSAVTSKAAANRLVREGLLVKIRFFPAELGGPNDPHNIGYIPPAAEEARQLLIGTLCRFTDEDLIDQLDVQADYKGESIVPSRIRLTATHSRGGEPVSAVVEIW